MKVATEAAAPCHHCSPFAIASAVVVVVSLYLRHILSCKEAMPIVPTCIHCFVVFDFIFWMVRIVPTLSFSRGYPISMIAPRLCVYALWMVGSAHYTCISVLFSSPLTRVQRTAYLPNREDERINDDDSVNLIQMIKRMIEQKGKRKRSQIKIRFDVCFVCFFFLVFCYSFHRLETFRMPYEGLYIERERALTCPLN